MTNSPKVKVNQRDLERVLLQLASVLKEGMDQGITQGWFHLPQSDHDALWLAASILQRSGQFPAYKLTFYHRGQGDDTCGVVFRCHESS
ncbi:MAG: hypothetical protein CV045_03035 [Cyanobacteria bacterium M5B4]|nr:MAG: hypothetical protein CV045_03035 [Cyanobacteria bacterium M5B4]